MYVHEKSATKARNKEFYSSRNVHGVCYIFGQGEVPDTHTSRVRSSPDAPGLGHATSTSGIG